MLRTSPWESSITKKSLHLLWVYFILLWKRKLFSFSRIKKIFEARENILEIIWSTTTTIYGGLNKMSPTAYGIWILGAQMVILCGEV